MANTSILNAFERMWQHTVAAVNTKVSYSESQALTSEQKSQARENIGAAIDIYDIVSPEMFGAVGDGVTDDSQAFIDALLIGKKVVCDSTKTYYFSNPIDIRTLTSGHLDGNNAYFINFHIYININDEFNDWRAAYSPNKFTIENMNFGIRNNGWGVEPEGWQTPLITTGVGVIVKNIKTICYPYVLATVDRYIDYTLCEGWINAGDPSVFDNYEINLDAISCLNKNGEYCRYSTSTSPSAQGDGWRIVQCNEYHMVNHPEYNFMGVFARRPLYVDSCIQSSFTIYRYSQIIFTGCHWESSFVVFNDNYLNTIKFINCFFYNNHILNNDESTIYDNCCFDVAGDAKISQYPLSYMTSNVSLYDMKCKFINCSFGNSTYIDSDALATAKKAPKRTYNWRSIDHRSKLDTKNFVVLTSNFSNCQFPMAGDYIYDIYLKSTYLPNVAIDYRQYVVNVSDIHSIVHIDFNFLVGGFSYTIIRTDPDGSMYQTEYYLDPTLTSDKYIVLNFGDYYSFAGPSVETDNATFLFSANMPWISITEKPSFTIHESLYEVNGLLVTSDNSDLNFGMYGDTGGAIQVSKDYVDLTIDSTLSTISERSVQNKVITQKIAEVEKAHTELLYGLSYKLPEEIVFDGVSEQQIVTTVKLFDEPKDFTIFIDATPSVDDYKVGTYLLDGIHNLNNSAVGGVGLRTGFSWHGESFILVGTNHQDQELCSQVNTTERTKMAIVYKQGVYNRWYFIKESDTTVSSKGIWSNLTFEYPQHDGVVVIGSQSNGENRFNGTIHDVEIYNYAFTEEEINKRLTSDNYEPANTFAFVPKVTTSDNNKVLTVVDGSPAWSILDAISTSVFTGHTDNSTVHITSTERENWNLAKTNADSAYNLANSKLDSNSEVNGGTW